jgi:hypothetical protein
MRAKPLRARERPGGDDAPLEFGDDIRSGTLRSIDRALRELEGRRLLSSTEVVDTLLDLRSTILLTAALEELSSERRCIDVAPPGRNR